MAKRTVAVQFENLDHRLNRVEQILPTLATKEDLRHAIEPLATKEDLRRAIEPLATKEALLATRDELRREIARAVEPLATKEALHELRDEFRRHMDVTREALQGSIDLLAEHLVRIATKVYGREARAQSAPV